MNPVSRYHVCVLTYCFDIKHQFDSFIFHHSKEGGHGALDLRQRIKQTRVGPGVPLRAVTDVVRKWNLTAST